MNSKLRAASCVTMSKSNTYQIYVYTNTNIRFFIRNHTLYTTFKVVNVYCGTDIYIYKYMDRVIWHSSTPVNGCMRTRTSMIMEYIYATKLIKDETRFSLHFWTTNDLQNEPIRLLFFFLFFSHFRSTMTHNIYIVYRFYANKESHWHAACIHTIFHTVYMLSDERWALMESMVENINISISLHSNFEIATS